ncbi:MAG: sensor histidine kinase [Calditrichaeota bacterium]|nr:MAG: sensor histidine kinase [Calditrichota bacterium]
MKMDSSHRDKLMFAEDTPPADDISLQSALPLSRLATQLAHDLNVPLASILAYAEELVDLAKERYGIDGFNQIVEYISIIQQEANQCKEIVEKMLTYAKGLEINLEIVNLHEVIEECIQKQALTVNDKPVKICREFDTHVPNITTDPTGLRQVITNILSNAYDAVDDNGEIVIRTRGQDKAVLVEISDNGAGIDEGHLERIFDPFFTTKAAGKGTGLGLAICNGILQTLKGRITVESEKGKGTSFKIWLPKKIKVILT